MSNRRGDSTAERLLIWNRPREITPEVTTLEVKTLEVKTIEKQPSIKNTGDDNKPRVNNLCRASARARGRGRGSLSLPPSLPLSRGEQPPGGQAPPPETRTLHPTPEPSLIYKVARNEPRANSLYASRSPRCAWRRRAVVGLGFGAWGSGFGVWDLGIGV